MTMIARDQKMRTSGTWNNAVDRQNTAALKSLVKRFGWPDKVLVGEEAAEGAWLLVQHADHDLTFQKSMLPILRRKARAGLIPILHYVYLLDRVNVNAGRPQRYGTQMRLKDGKFMPHPIGDKKTLDRRRKNVGLETFAAYVSRMKERNAALQEKQNKKNTSR